MKILSILLSAALLIPMTASAYSLPNEFGQFKTYSNENLQAQFTSSNFYTAWQSTKGSISVKIGIIDAFGEGEYHGNAVLSLMNSKHNDGGLAGYAPNLTYVKKDGCDDIRCDTAKTATFIRELIDQDHVKIINISAIFNEDDDLRSAFEYAQERGVLIVTATNNKYLGYTPFNCTTELTLCVGTAYRFEDGADKKMYNPTSIKLIAHGYFPRVMWGDKITGKMGTSFAAPAVTAAAGIMVSLDGSLKADQLREILLSTGDEVSTGRIRLNAGNAIYKVNNPNQDIPEEAFEPAEDEIPVGGNETVSEPVSSTEDDAVITAYKRARSEGRITSTLKLILLYLLTK